MKKEKIKIVVTVSISYDEGYREEAVAQAIDNANSVKTYGGNYTVMPEKAIEVKKKKQDKM